MELLKNQPIRLPGLSLDFARDGELIEPKPGVFRVETERRFSPRFNHRLGAVERINGGEGGVKPARDPRLE